MLNHDSTRSTKQAGDAFHSKLCHPRNIARVLQHDLEQLVQVSITDIEELAPLLAQVPSTLTDTHIQSENVYQYALHLDDCIALLKDYYFPLKTLVKDPGIKAKQGYALGKAAWNGAKASSLALCELLQTTSPAAHSVRDLYNETYRTSAFAITAATDAAKLYGWRILSTLLQELTGRNFAIQKHAPCEAELQTVSRALLQSCHSRLAKAIEDDRSINGTPSEWRFVLQGCRALQLCIVCWESKDEAAQRTLLTALGSLALYTGDTQFLRHILKYRDQRTDIICSALSAYARSGVTVDIDRESAIVRLGAETTKEAIDFRALVRRDLVTRINTIVDKRDLKNFALYRGHLRELVRHGPCGLDDIISLIAGSIKKVQKQTPQFLKGSLEVLFHSPFLSLTLPTSQVPTGSSEIVAKRVANLRADLCATACDLVADASIDPDCRTIALHLSAQHGYFHDTTRILCSEILVSAQRFSEIADKKKWDLIIRRSPIAQHPAVMKLI